MPAGRLDRLSAAVATLLRTVVESEAATSRDVRRAILDGADAPAALVAYIDRVLRRAYRVTDADIAALRDTGYSEDEIFEVTVAAALGAASERLDAGLRLLDRLVH